MNLKKGEGLRVNIADLDAAIPKAEYTSKPCLLLVHKTRSKWRVRYVNDIPPCAVSPSACPMTLVTDALKSIPVFDAPMAQVLAYIKEIDWSHTLYVRLQSGNLIEINGGADRVEFKPIPF